MQVTWIPCSGKKRKKEEERHTLCTNTLSLIEVPTTPELFIRPPLGNDQELKHRTSLNKSWGKKWKQYLLFFILSCVNNKTLAGLLELFICAVCAVSSPPA